MFMVVSFFFNMLFTIMMTKCRKCVHFVFTDSSTRPCVAKDLFYLPYRPQRLTRFVWPSSNLKLKPSSETQACLVGAERSKTCSTIGATNVYNNDITVPGKLLLSAISVSYWAQIKFVLNRCWLRHFHAVQHWVVFAVDRYTCDTLSTKVQLRKCQKMFRQFPRKRKV